MSLEFCRVPAVVLLVSDTSTTAAVMKAILSARDECFVRSVMGQEQGVLLMVGRFM